MTQPCECIEKSIRELLQGSGYDMRIIDGQIVFISAQVIDVELENPELMVRQLMGGRRDDSTGD